jgi:DinB family protein
METGRFAPGPPLIGSSVMQLGFRMQVTRDLEKTRDETLRYFSLDQRDLTRTYAPGKWSVRFVLHHIADSETVLFDRIRRVLSEPRQVLWAFDQDAWAAGLDYSQVPLDISRQVYESVRNAIIYYAGVHYERNGHLEFVHSETGVRTLKDEFDKVASHNEHHLNQIRLALQGRPGA